MKFRHLTVLACLSLFSCGPSKDELADALGRRPSELSNVECTEAVGQLGYNCAFTYLGNSIARRVQKGDSGWRTF